MNDTGAIFRGDHKTKEVLNMNTTVEKWSIGDRIEGVCMCTPSKRVVLEVTQLEDNWVWFKDVAKGTVIQCGFYLPDYRTLESATKANFIGNYSKYTYNRIPRKSEDVWQVGDILRGECRCDSSKTIDFEYLGGLKFKHTDGWTQFYSSMNDSSTPQEIIHVFYFKNKSDYTNWRRVASQHNSLTHQEPKSGSYDPRSACLDASRLVSGSVTHRTSVDYEFGDCIKVRGFEYQIKHYSGLSTQGIHLEKKEPPKPIICEYQIAHSHLCGEFFEVRFRLSEDTPDYYGRCSSYVFLNLSPLSTRTNYAQEIRIGSDARGMWSTPIIVPRNIKDQLSSICTEVGRVLTIEANKDA